PGDLCGDLCLLLQIFIFTTAKRDYAEKVLDVLDPKKKLISRTDCLCARGSYWKDLTRLGRDLAKTVALDHPRRRGAGQRRPLGGAGEARTAIGSRSPERPGSQLIPWCWAGVLAKPLPPGPSLGVCSRALPAFPGRLRGVDPSAF
uniref:Mitochondrial import inner membrane translocase subunit TIM50 n=1 Tax=Accipiter nisus TaxID=211598 RepID=A0A8B9MH06_9AVES